MHGRNRTVAGVAFGGILVATLALVPAARAAFSDAREQPVVVQSEERPMRVDSGLVNAPRGGDNPVVVFSQVVGDDDAHWVRLIFREVQLSGSINDGTHARLRITSLHDGGRQYLDAVSIQHWRLSSAYFNGSSVLMELLAHPGTEPSRVVLDRIRIGVLAAPGDDMVASICGGTDVRIPSNGPADARVGDSIGSPYCTAFLIGRQCMLSAGHCVDDDWFDGWTPAPVVSFNVPMSMHTGAPLQAHPDDQYPIDHQSVQHQQGEAGHDWVFFGVHPNSNTQLLPFDAQRAYYALVPAGEVPEANQQLLVVRGYGINNPPAGVRLLPATWNYVQKSGVGAFIAMSGTTIHHTVDTTGGNSGSAIVLARGHRAGQVIGIHTHGGCDPHPPGGVDENRGTVISHFSLQFALTNPTGVCATQQPIDPDLFPPMTPAPYGNWGWDTAIGNPGVTGFIPVVAALEPFNDGDQSFPNQSTSLYVGGTFDAAGGVPAANIARWTWNRTTGQHEWSAVGGGINGSVHVMKALDIGDGRGPALYVGGNFTEAGGVPANRIARWVWAGTGPQWRWEALGGGMNGSVSALALFGGSLYAAGSFTQADGQTVNRIARWDAAVDQWVAVGPNCPGTPGDGCGLSGSVADMVVFDRGDGEALYLTGTFVQAGGLTVNRLARYDGQSWSDMGGGLTGYAQPNGSALAVFDDDGAFGPALYIGGYFTEVDNLGPYFRHVARARWVNNQWEWGPLWGHNNNNGTSFTVWALHVFDKGEGPRLYVGGNFNFAGIDQVNNIARWNGFWVGWSGVGPHCPGTISSGCGTTPGVIAMTTYDDGSGNGPALYAGGHFTNAGGATVGRIASWHTSRLERLGDLSGDGVVDVLDLLILLAAWGPCPPPCPADLNGDGSVDVQDLLILLANWG